MNSSVILKIAERAMKGRHELTCSQYPAPFVLRIYTCTYCYTNILTLLSCLSKLKTVTFKFDQYFQWEKYVHS